MQQIISLAKDLHINLVPWNWHSRSHYPLPKYVQTWCIKGRLSANKHNVQRVAMLDLDNKYEETLAFVKSVYDKFLDGEDAPLHSVSTVHIGTDGVLWRSESYRHYVNDMIQYIKGKRPTPRIWGSLSAKQGSTPVDWKDVKLISGYWLATSTGSNCSRVPRLSISQDIPTYSVPSGSNSQRWLYGDYANYETQVQPMDANDFSTGGRPRLETSNPNIIGGGHQFWNDNMTSMKPDLLLTISLNVSSRL